MALLPAALALPLHQIHYTNQRPGDSGGGRDLSQCVARWRTMTLLYLFRVLPSARGGGLSSGGPDRFQSRQAVELKVRRIQIDRSQWALGSGVIEIQWELGSGVIGSQWALGSGVIGSQWALGSGVVGPATERLKKRFSKIWFGLLFLWIFSYVNPLVSQ